MLETVTLDGLAALPSGPELGALLGRITLPAVPNDQIIDVLVAEHRQLAHQQARLWAVLDEVARCDPDARIDPTLPPPLRGP